VGEGMSAKEAESLIHSLEATGLKARTIPNHQLIEVPEPRVPVEIDLLNQGLFLKFKSAQGVVPWKSLSLISAYSLGETTIRTEKVTTGPTAGEQLFRVGVLLATGIPLPGKKKKTETVKKETHEDYYFIELCTQKPWGRIRLNAQTLKYSFLKEKMQYNALNNFRTLLGELFVRIPGAILNHGARVIKSSQPLNQMAYESLREVDKETRWLLTLLNVS
jgi:hypothetical protein